MTDSCFKVSWLDSTRMQSNIHLTADNQKALCGYNFSFCFVDGRWVPYRSGNKKHFCKSCMAIAKDMKMKISGWSSVVPENDFTKTYQEIRRLK